LKRRIELSKAEKALKALKRHYGGDAFRVEKEHPFRALVGCILSQRTRDENASKAANALFAVASTPQEILALEPETLRQLIRHSGYYNQKAKHIVGACKGIIEKFGGETPRTRDELLTLPGVGPKTADIVLSYGYGEPAIAVDTHIHRVSKRTGITGMKAKPTDAKDALQSALPQRDWVYADGALLQLGKDYCKPTEPRCGECPLREICDYEKRA
jgi:endonuclease-3